MDRDAFLDLPRYSGVYLALTPLYATELFLQFHQLCIHLATHVRVDEVYDVAEEHQINVRCQNIKSFLKPRILGMMSPSKT